MPIDRKKFLGYEMPPHVAVVDEWRARFFAKAVGEPDPIYSDVAAAKAAGHRGLPLMPTMLFCMEQGRPDGYKLTEQMGVPIARLLHGEQHFDFKRQVYAGDVLTFRTKITDIYDKKGGALEFFERTTTISDQSNQVAGILRGIAVVRQLG